MDGPTKWYPTDEFTSKGELLQELAEDVDVVEPTIRVTNSMSDELILVFNEPMDAIRFAGQMTKAAVELYLLVCSST